MRGSTLVRVFFQKRINRKEEAAPFYKYNIVCKKIGWGVSIPDNLFLVILPKIVA